MTILETSEAILSRLKEIDGPKTCEDWGGEIDDLIKQVAKLPGMFVVYSGARFAPKSSISNNLAEHADTWDIIVIDKNLRGKDAAASGCYVLVEAVREKLIGFEIGDAWLWPISEDLIYSKKGKMAYACTYMIETETED
ncbi:MAG: DUF1834 family protein [Desulfuromusa sp.]|nr:DUF1834 family protein [Desulfuromusa sp.]